MKPFIALLLTSLAFAQTPKRLQFEVASVHQVEKLDVGAQTPAAAQVTATNVRLSYLLMRDFITRAYQVKAYQVVGPEWITQERYDITATLPAGSTVAQVPATMQTLLEDRSGIKVHKSQKEFNVYMLTRNKRGFELKDVGPRDADATLTGVAPPKAPGGMALNLARGGLFSITDTAMDGYGMSMDMVANTLTQFLDSPLIDATDIQGFYNIHADLKPEDASGMMVRAAMNRGVQYPPELVAELTGSSPGSLIEALDRMGLKLEKAKAPLDVINIDSLNKVPTEN